MDEQGEATAEKVMEPGSEVDDTSTWTAWLG